MRTTRATAIAAVVTALGAVGVAAALAGENESGFKTSTPAMLVPVAPGVTTEALLTVGDSLPGGYRFESIPDGIAIKTRGQGRLDVWVNHETSLVPFPVRNPATPATLAANPTTFHDYTNALVSQLTINQHSGGLLQGRIVLPSEANYQRFCSNTLVGAPQGFERELLLTNEEAQDFVARSGTAWPVATNDPSREQAGVVVAYDIKSGEYRSVLGMGRHNHENSVALPGFGQPVVISGDDTFTSNPPNSQLYMYMALNGAGVWNDRGKLYAFVLDNQSKPNYNNVSTADGALTGEFKEVPRDIARGKDPVTGAELDSSILTVPGTPPGGTPNGPQWLLDQWGNAENNSYGKNVFDFIRIEDIAYDKRPGMWNVLYLADSGRGSGLAPNGRIWRMELDRSNPAKVTSLTILLEGGTALGSGSLHQPDNLETTATSLLIQEDPSSGNTYAPPEGAGKTTARIWRYDLVAGGPPEIVARVSQALDPAAKLGSWESSGIIDASAAFGPGWFLVDVQAGSLTTDRTVVEPDSPTDTDAIVDAVREREGGQLLRIYIPGT